MSTENDELIAEARARHALTAKHLPDPDAPTLVSRLADALEAATKPVTVSGLDLNEIRARVANCQTYNFGMRDADQIAHEDAPAMLEILEAISGSPHIDAKHWRQLQEARARVRELEALAAPVTVNTAAEMGELAPGSVTLDADGQTERIPVNWCCPGCRNNRFDTWADRVAFPATVIFTPRREGE